jgi:hypothetical protein
MHCRTNANWILLDNCLSINVFCNKKLLTNIRKDDISLNIHCNVGTKVVAQAGALNNYCTVWYSEDAIVKILSLSQVKKQFTIRYDSLKGNKFIVITPGKEIIFKESK